MRDEDIPGWGVGLRGDKTLDYDASEPTGYRHAHRRGRPRYPFGYGLAYTTFELVDARLTDEPERDLVTVVATVRNTGDRAGRDVIQAYVRAPGEIDCRLAGYGAIELACGETGTVDIHPRRACIPALAQPAGRWSVPQGSHQVLIGRSSVDLPVTAAVQR